jgi:hypothetical protein
VSCRGANLSFSEVVSLLGLADDDEVLAGTSEESRKRALWQFYSTGMLTHSHSDGEFPIYSQGECTDGFAEKIRTRATGHVSHRADDMLT